ncbi:hypothetical protein DERP_000438, partial [Dermatophagoides pteronyssinus]
ENFFFHYKELEYNLIENNEKKGKSMLYNKPSFYDNIFTIISMQFHGFQSINYNSYKYNKILISSWDKMDAEENMKYSLDSI